MIQSFTTRFLIGCLCFILVSNEAEGQKIWQKEFSDHSFGSRANYNDAVVHKGGRLCICGTTEESYNESALTIASLDTALNQLWTFRDTSRTPSMPEYNIRCAADTNSGNTVVTGAYFVWVAGGGLAPHTALVSYDSLGNINWDLIVPVSYAEPQTINIDSSGNIYIGVTVHENGYNESHILKYNRNGTLIWNKFYPEFASDIYEISAVLLNKSRSGNSICIVKSYNQLRAFMFSQQDGSIVWMSPLFGGTDRPILFGNAIWLTNNNGWAMGYSEVVPASVNYNFNVVTFSPANNYGWTATYDGGFGLSDYLEKIASGNNQIIATGQGYQLGKLDLLTVAFDLNNGSLIWANRKDFYGEDDAASDVKTDQYGNVYVSGFTEAGPWHHDAVILKYSSDGNELMVMKDEGSPVSEQEYRKIIIDTATQQLTTIGMHRRFERPEMPFFPFHVDLSARKRDLVSGNITHSSTIGGQGKGFYSGRWTKADALGNVYFAGYRNLGFTIVDMGGYRDIFDLVLLKYSSTGELLWHYVLDPNVHNEAWPPEIGLIDENQSPVLLVSRHYSEQDKKTVLLKFTPDGTLEWELPITAQGTTYSQAENLVISSGNNYFVALRDHPYMKIIKINTNGEIVWSVNAGSLTTDCTDFSLVKMQVSLQEEVFFSLRYNSCWPNDVIYKISSDGQVQWSQPLEGGTPTKDLLLFDDLFVLTDNNLTRINSATGDKEWVTALPSDESGIKLHWYNNQIVTTSDKYLRHLLPENGAIVFEKKVNFPWLFFFQEDHIVLSETDYYATVINYSGDTIGVITCPECAIYAAFYPEVSNNTWGWGYRTAGMDVKDGFIYWGGTRNELLHTGGIFGPDAAGANVLHLIKYKYADQLSGTALPYPYAPEVQVIPNPNTGHFTILLDQWTEHRSVSVKISDVMGQVVWMAEKVTERHVNIDLKGGAGVYFIQINDGTRRSVTRTVTHLSH